MMNNKIILTILFWVNITNAQWIPDGNIVCDTNINRAIHPLPSIASDGEGGAYICWRDVRDSLGGYSIYAQHVESSGKMSWQRNGIPIVQANNQQEFQRIRPDGKGGAFIAWEDARSNIHKYPYVQRINKEGKFLWQTNGIKASDRGGLFISINPDSWNGLLLGWSTVYDAYVQRLDGFGNRMWGDSGVQVTNRPGSVRPNDVEIISDGAGGAIVAWSEGEYPQEQIYAQRVDSLGKICWSKNGILLSGTTLEEHRLVALISDLKGGAIINWNNRFIGYAQKIDKYGNILWDAGGIKLDSSGTGGGKRITPDGKGGVFIGQGLKIHHIDSAGNKLWGGGINYFDTLGTTNSAQVTAGLAGVYNFADAQTNILAQWIDINGNIRFGTKGIEVAPNRTRVYQGWPSATTDGRSGALVCWESLSQELYVRIYVAKIDTAGVVTGFKNESIIIPSVPHLEQNYPNPFNPTTTIRYALPTNSSVKITIFNTLGQEVAVLTNGEKEAGYHEVKWQANVVSGIYFYRLEAVDINNPNNRFVEVKKMSFIK